MLGPLQVDASDARLSPRDRVVLTALALQCGEVVSGERLADALWGERVPPSWSKVVQGCVVRLRKALGPGTISTEPNGYRLTIAAEELDVSRFEPRSERARELLVLGDPERALVAVEEGLVLWRGRPLVDTDDWEPACIEVHRLEELRMEAEELRIDVALRAGRHREVLAAAQAVVDLAPTRERRWELLALAQYRSGRQGDALRTLQLARSILARELGLDPGPELRALERAVLEQDPSLAPPDALPYPSASCPWPGLLAYGIGEAEDFFGRDAEVDACLSRLDVDGAVVVVGPSGSGKSSLVRAGVGARLRRQGRRVVVVVPGPRPLDSLESLSESPAGFVLVVDQCEEVVTRCEDPVERDAFLDALVEHARTAPLVVALRADRIGEVSAHAGFARLLERALFLLGPMDEAAVRTAVGGPARRAGLLLEPGLVDLVVRDVRAEPGALPLMSHALRQTWARREGRTLTVEAYRETGGISAAVARSAEQVYADADVDERVKLRDLLLRLVTPVDGGDPARVRLSRRVVAGNPSYEHLVERLVTARLLTSDESVVELAHEAVARAWPRLREWLDDDIEGLRVLRHLTATATGWDALGRPPSELYRGPRLEQTRVWYERSQPDLTPVERDFLDASFEAEATALRAAEDQIQQQRRTVRKLRRLVVGVGALAAVAAIASSVALVQRGRADDEARVAEARRVAAEALVAEPIDRALLLAVEAVRLWDSPETRGSLLTTIDRSPHLAGVIRSAGPRLLGLDIAPTGHAVTVDAAGDVTVRELATRSTIGVRAADGASHLAASFSPDGQHLAVSWQATQCFFEYPCRDLGVDVVDADDPAGPAVTYTGFSEPAADVEFFARRPTARRRPVVPAGGQRGQHRRVDNR